jgi:hypothetical protein
VLKRKPSIQSKPNNALAGDTDVHPTECQPRLGIRSPREAVEIEKVVSPVKYGRLDAESEDASLGRDDEAAELDAIEPVLHLDGDRLLSRRGQRRQVELDLKRLRVQDGKHQAGPAFSGNGLAARELLLPTSTQQPCFGGLDTISALILELMGPPQGVVEVCTPLGSPAALERWTAVSVKAHKQGHQDDQ